MNPERLLKLFDRVAEAPDAVVRLRRLVLDLAVRGKLVEQNSREEPAALLLATIHAESAQPIKKKITEYSFAVPYILPKSWHWSKIEEISHNWGQKIPDKHFTYIDVSAIDSKRGVISSPSVVEPKKAPSRARKIVQVGSVIYSTVRPYLLNVAVIEKEYSPEPIASTAFSILHPFEGVYNRYLWYWLRSPAFIEIVSEKMRGQAYPAINERNFAALPIPIPPTLEQYRIVQRVDELMALCDQLEAAQTNREQRRDRLSAAALDRLVNAEPSEEGHTAARFYLNRLPRLVWKVEHVRALRRTVLDLAVRGNLTIQKPEDEKLSFKSLNYEDFIFNIPPNWLWTKMGLLTSFVTSGSRGWAQYYSKDGAIFIRIGNLDYDSIRIDLHYTQCVDPPKSAEGTRTRVVPGDILISITGDTGMVGLVPKSISDAYINQHIALARPLPGLCNEYLARYCTSTYALQFLKNSQRGIKNSLGLNDIRNLPVPLPPLAEQHRIVQRVDELMILCDQLEVVLQTSQQTTSRLLDALIAEALSEESPDLETFETETQLALSD